MRFTRLFCTTSLLLLVSMALRADGPGDNSADKVRPVPPPGVEVPDETRKALEAELKTLADDITKIRAAQANKPALRYLPDVQVFHDAVKIALEHGEFFDVKEFDQAKKLITMGRERAAHLTQGKTPWLTVPGLVPRGYLSEIDGSVQPYGLVVPAGYQPGSPHRYRLDLWCHGRGEKLSELSFLSQRSTSPGEFTPPGAIVLHLYGRYCNAKKFAGEVDAFEAMADVKKDYAIDSDRIVVRGFSMGGAACWQFAVHYPGVFCAAAPGAGFAETPEFLKTFQKETITPNAWEKKLLGWYDCTEWAANLSMLPTVAYSGDKDSQKQAADIMEKACAKHGLRLTHLIGPNTAHSYHAGTKLLLNERIDAIATRGRDPSPRMVLFTTRTLRYADCRWIRVTGLKTHWEEGKVLATIAENDALVEVQSQGITGLEFRFGPGEAPLALGSPKVTIQFVEGETKSEVDVPGAMTDRSWNVSFHKNSEGHWTAGEPKGDGLRKQPGLQGPIDDAFCSSFIVVRPTGKSNNPKVQAWVDAELARFLKEWRKQFRGTARVVDDTKLTEADIAKHHLVVWGDPTSNSVLARLKDKLGFAWTDASVNLSGKPLPSAGHVPVLIRPNPLNPVKYIVVNSGPTYREYDYLNNARQIPRLPDWAVIDLATAPNARRPGGIAAAGFYDERWQLTKGE